MEVSSFWTYGRLKLWKSRGFRIAFIWIVLLGSIAVFADFILALLDFTAFEILETESSYQAPFSKSTEGIHFFGTDHLGRDLMARMIYGSRHSLSIALISSFIALGIGVSVGMLSAYYGNKLRKQKVLLVLVSLLLFVAFCYLAIWLNSRIYALLSFAVLSLLFVGKGTTGIPIPIDSLVLRLIEFMRAIPTLVILIVAHYLFEYWNFWFVSALFGLLSWPRFAVYVRSEIEGRKTKTVVDAARLSGLSTRKILWEYLLPDLVGPITVIFLFTAARIIIVESSLAFVGIYYGIESVSWGEILSEANRNIQAWWIGLFPILAITLTVYALLYCGQKVVELQRPRRQFA